MSGTRHRKGWQRLSQRAYPLPRNGRQGNAMQAQEIEGVAGRHSAAVATQEVCYAEPPGAQGSPAPQIGAYRLH